VREAHLKKLEARAARVKNLLLPDSIVFNGMDTEIGDPKDRLREIIKRVAGFPEHLNPGETFKGVIRDVEQFLEHDMAELVEAVREANREARQARQELSARAGTRYQITISSDAPLDVLTREVIQPERSDLRDLAEDEPGHGYHEAGDYQ
jgi:hypothetical protein